MPIGLYALHSVYKSKNSNDGNIHSLDCVSAYGFLHLHRNLIIGIQNFWIGYALIMNTISYSDFS